MRKLITRITSVRTVKVYYLGDEVTFESIDLTTSVEAIYDRVHNEDMLEFLTAKSLGIEAQVQQRG